MIPAIYLEPYYEKFTSGDSLYSIVRELRESYEWSMTRMGSYEFDLTNYNYVKDKLIYRLVNYEKKKVFPVDLKTSGHPEWDFCDSFITWGYSWQARLYWRIIRANMDADDYFKDFSLEDYRFIVVNRKTLTPLVWEFPLTRSNGSLMTEDGKEVRDPFAIGRELRGYLDCRPPVPNGINTVGVNIINCLTEV